jgi:hypothetical protein
MLSRFKTRYLDVVGDPLGMGIIAVMLYLSFQIFADILAIKVTTLCSVKED